MGRTSTIPPPAAAIQGPTLSRPLAQLKAHIMMPRHGRFSIPLSSHRLYPMLMCSAPRYCANFLQSASLRAVARCMRFTTEKRCGGQVYCFQSSGDRRCRSVLHEKALGRELDLVPHARPVLKRGQTLLSRDRAADPRYCLPIPC